VSFALLLLLASAVAIVAIAGRSSLAEKLFSRELYKELMKGSVRSVADIIDMYELEQYNFLPIVVPDPDLIHVQDGGLLPLNPRTFPRDFVSGLVPVEESPGVTVFPITVYEHPKTRERIILNEKNIRIAGQHTPLSYDPRWYVKENYRGFEELNPEEAERIASIHDPSRIAVTYKLILRDDLIKYVWKASLATPSAAQAEEVGGGGMLLCGWEGGSVSNIQFTAIEKCSDGIEVVIAYPDTFTNALDIFVCDGPRAMADFWCEHAVTTNTNPSTNWISWVDTESTNSHVRCRVYAAADSVADTDEDGFTDGFEKYVSHTCTTNPGSYPVSVSGDISYAGTVTGPIRMLAVTAEDPWIGPTVTIGSPGSYENDRVANNTSYRFKAYRDRDHSKTRGFGEPWGVYSDDAVLVTNDLSGVDITLIDRDEDEDGLPDWWEVQYFGTSTNTGAGDPDGDGLANSNEWACGSNPTDSDSDGDGMGDGAEVANGQDPATPDTYATLPFFDDFEIFDKLSGSISATNFGYSLDLDGDRLVVGAVGTAGATNGLAYVFVFDGTNWNQQAELHPWASTAGDSFGCSVATHGNRVIVGASSDSTNGASSGAAYVYFWTGSAWSNEVKLSAYDGASGDCFGFAVGISSNAIAVGAPYDDVSSTDSGSVYVYSTAGAFWWTNTPTRLYDGNSLSERFGSSIDFSPDAEVLAIGQHYYHLWNYGAVSVFRWSGTAWTDQRRLTASDAASNHMFGRSVSLGNGVLLIGAPGHKGSGETRSGAAYIFELSPTSWAWTQAQRLKPSDLEAEDYFGQSVILSSSFLAVGSYLADASGTDSGAAYLYESDGTNWTQEAKVSQRIGASAGDMVSWAIGLTGDTLLVSAHKVVSGTPPHSGAVYTLPVTNVLNWGDDADWLLHNYNGWQASPTNRVVLAGGSYSGALAAAFCESFDIVSAHHLFAAHGQTNVWIDCYAKFNPSNTVASCETPDLDDAPDWFPSFFAVNHRCRIVAYHGDGTNSAWSVCTNVVVSPGYNRYTVKHDYVAKTWDLYFNGTNIFTDIGFRDSEIVEFSRFSFTGKWADDSSIDDVSIGLTRPSGLTD